MMDYQDIVKAKTEKWKSAIDGFQEQVSSGEEVTTSLKASITANLEFWEQLKANKPSA